MLTVAFSLAVVVGHGLAKQDTGQQTTSVRVVCSVIIVYSRRAGLVARGLLLVAGALVVARGGR